MLHVVPDYLKQSQLQVQQRKKLILSKFKKIECFHSVGSSSICPTSLSAVSTPQLNWGCYQDSHSKPKSILSATDQLQVQDTAQSHQFLRGMNILWYLIHLQMKDQSNFCFSCICLDSLYILILSSKRQTIDIKQTRS